ncbi:MAG: UDP-N-acetylmuramoyl-tripeptide--D-alanyl-D-alanine ligase [Deltaproteobacteria bacterium]|nr:UDP-N-acetylmuramoyl-tripeptide--D-alanyl-D-alanine ligase [Deltaproteobacteria bacterium]TLN02649.1 MAG: UDP-N-acetylmuramoyl-tripeptide--D-alanyl-D-alanine ligase [bacterium]
MPTFTVSEIAAVVGGRVSGAVDSVVQGVSTDSRSVEPGELFVPLRGERFDGHRFIAAALARGVNVILAEQGSYDLDSLPAGTSCISVPDTLRALGDLAAFHRKRFSLPVVAITGSNGKTTTKEMLATILTCRGEGLKTAGNLNNLIGLPQMVFQLRASHNWAVLEMGMSEPGEIDRLAEIARPDLGVITNVAPAHLLSMGTVAAVAAAKGELFLRLRPGSSAIFNADDPLVSGLPTPSGVSRTSFGLAEADVRAEKIETLGRAGQAFFLSLPSGMIAVKMKVFGRHNIQNALAAAAAAHLLGLGPDEIRQGLESFSPVAKRLSPEELDGILLIDDSYNANPASMRAALTTLAGLKGAGRGIAVLGDMLELGESSPAAHEEIGRLAAQCVERLYLLGELAEYVARGAAAGGLPAASVVCARNHAEILDDLTSSLRTGDCILVKGSRGMRMETVAEGLRNKFPAGTAKGAVN